MKKFLSKSKPYLFPSNSLDPTLLGRFKLGLINYIGVRSWWRSSCLQAWLKSADFRFCCRIGQNQYTVVVSGNDITHVWVANEVLVEKVYDLSVVPFEPNIIFDIGANIGLFSLIAASKWPTAKLISVEPHPTTFCYLVKNLQANGVKAAKLQCALDGRSGVKYLLNEGAVFQSTTHQPTGIFTFCLRLDALLESLTACKILIKMDIEGAEQVVLDSLTVDLPRETFVFIELHSGDASVTWVSHWASTNGFEFVQVRRRGEAIDGFLRRA